jgi:hypothetical protein
MRAVGEWPAALLTIAALACQPDEAMQPTEPRSPQPYVIEDAQHGDESRRNPHFFWLPPMVPAPNPPPGGTPDPSVLADLRVEVCDLGTSRPSGTTCSGKPLMAVFTSLQAIYLATTDQGLTTTASTTSSELLRYDAAGGHFLVNWRTDRTALLTTHFYRLRVLAAGVELGQADIDVLRNPSELKNYDTGNSIPLVDGRTLPVKFRVEQGAIAVLEPGDPPAEIGPAGGIVATSDGEVAIRVTAGAVSEGTAFSAEPATAYPAGAESWAPVYEFTTSATSFQEPVTLTLAVDFDLLPAQVPPTALALYVASDEGWHEVPNSSVNLTEGTVSAPVEHFSIYTVRISPNTLSGPPTPSTLEVGQATQLSGYAASQQVRDTVVCTWGGPFNSVQTCKSYPTTTYTPEPGTAIYWTSSDPSVASLPSGSVSYTNQNGAFASPPVLARAPGVANVLASTLPGGAGVRSNIIAITVVAPAPGITGYQVIAQQVNQAAAVDANGTHTSSGKYYQAVCPAGTKIFGGGYQDVLTGGAGFTASNSYRIYDSRPIGDDRWRVRLDKQLAGDGYFFVYALCASPLPGYEVVTRQVFGSSALPGNYYQAVCPAGKKVLSGGYSDILTGGIGFDASNSYSLWGSSPSNDNGWRVRLDKAIAGDGYFFVYAICAPPPANYEIVTVQASGANAVNGGRYFQALCNGGKKVLGGGYSEVITGGIGFDAANSYSIYDSNPLGTAFDRWQVKLDKALIGDGYFFMHAICATASP